MEIKPFLSTQGVISYLIISKENQTILIDPSFEMTQKIMIFIKEKSLKLEYLLETHTHADFLSSKYLFKTIYPNIKTGSSKYSTTKYKDLQLKHEDQIRLDDINLTVWETPGHTHDSLSFVVNNKSIFTGDTLLIGGTGRTDFQQGDSKNLYQSLEKILTLSETTIIYPGHNYQGQVKTTLGVEKQTNQRLKLVAENQEDEFVKLMNDHSPKKPDLFDASILWNSL